jgi:hypothetical protein
MQLIERRFMFHGSVVGFAGHIRRPQDTILPVKGSAVVPSTGGYAHVEHQAESVPRLYSFSSISSTVTGDFTDLEAAKQRTLQNPSMDPPLSAITRAHCRVEHLTLLERLTIDKCELNLSSVHSAAHSPVFSSRGSAIVGLRLDGYLLNIQLDNDIFSGPLGTKKGICDRYEREEAFRHRIISDPDHKQGDNPNRPPEIHGHIACSLVRSIDWVGDENPHAKIEASHIIHLEDFGYIYLGELFITDEYRQVTLVRVQLGSQVGGDHSCCSGQVNGHDTAPVAG